MRDQARRSTCSHASPETIACWLAAVAASRERFFSASASFSASISLTTSSISGSVRFWLDPCVVQSQRLAHASKRRRMATVAHLQLAEAVHDGDLDILGARLDDLEQRLDCQLDRLVPRHVVPMVLLEELADRL
jgi:hypothetical protein